MYHTAKPENRKVVAGLLLSAALTSFLTGITEPVEFSFLFVAPVLYVIHAFFDGLAFMVAHILHITIGQTFSGGLIDFLLFGVLKGESKTNWMYVPIVGIPWFFLYYFTFRYLINRFGWLKMCIRDRYNAHRKLGIESFHSAPLSRQNNTVIKKYGL